MVNKTHWASALGEKAILFWEREIKASKHTYKNTTASWKKCAKEKEQASMKDNERGDL